MEYPNLEYEELEVGDVFKMYPNSSLLYEKTNDTDAKCLEADFGIVLGKKDNVIIIKNT
jgi:hypothetical protein